MSVDSNIRDHKAWLGYLQPDGLVVSPAALVDAQVLLNANAKPLQEQFEEYTEEVESEDGTVDVAVKLSRVLTEFLEWPAKELAGLNDDYPVPEELKIPLKNFGETLEPTLALRDKRAQKGDPPWLMLIEELPIGTDLDVPIESAMAGWSASPTRRFERLLREAQVPIGLQCNGTHFRLIYAPRGENTGTLTFRVADMAAVAGRPILAAFEMLLSKYQLFAAPSDSRLPGLLQKSREYQAQVSTMLAQQVLDALYELLRGFQAAHDQTHGALLKDILADQPGAIYEGLLTTLMRLVFLLYAEDRGLMPNTSLYAGNYALHGLFERLRNDAERYPDTMDARYGAWAQLLALFRAVHGGCEVPTLKMPPRMGHLFDPERFPFLEGRSVPDPKMPLVADGVVYRVLDKLLMLKGERLSYRTLDVEQIGSVYETMMGFRLETAQGQTVALRPAIRMGAPVPVNLEALLAKAPKDRAKWVQGATDYNLPTALAKAVKEAATIDALLAAFERRIARNATPQPVPAGTMVLTPTDERRKTGSHYTPRSLTEPIVRTTLEPVLAQFGEHPKPDQILDLKICDPAMGSGAFLVEACRQLADALVEAWASHGYKPHIPADEDELLFARRIVAQRCLYGVDRNPMAVNLAKLSLWLATLAKDQPFTFVDHALRAGDSLVGLSRKQILAFNWDLSGTSTTSYGEEWMRERIDRAIEERRTILTAGDEMPPPVKAKRLKLADDALKPIRLAGDACIAAFFSESKNNKRHEARERLANANDQLTQGLDPALLSQLHEAVHGLREGPMPITPFHWEIEFPEVFTGKEGGLDAIVGNPPFAGKNNLINGNRAGYLDWLKTEHEGAHGNADVVAHFFRRAFHLIRPDGTFGLIATNTIGQGDTRATGLRHICTHGGTIYNAHKRYKWPGLAAVVVSVVHVCKGEAPPPYFLDDKEVDQITAFLFHAGGHDNPETLKANAGKSFIGSYVLGMGFTFDDTDTKGVATPIAEMHRLIEKDPKNAEVIFPYIGGEEINTSPTHAHHRYVINFQEWPLDRTAGGSWADTMHKAQLGNEEAARQINQWLAAGSVPRDYPEPVAADYPELLAIVEERVKPERMLQKDQGAKQMWWRFIRPRGLLYATIRGMERVLAISRVGQQCTFAFLAAGQIYAESTVVLAFFTFSGFALVQSRAHEFWARFFGSSMKDDLRYTPSDCFETFPFPEGFESDSQLEAAGKAYYEYRADLMVRNDEGLTRTYNRFHDPEETSPEIIELRRLHDAMDRAVLAAYGWDDLEPTCDYLLDYEDEEEPDDSGRTSRRRKPWRYRWPDSLRDEVLARLLKLNAERAEEERRSGKTAAAKRARGK